MAIYYLWGFNPPAPHRIGNATRVANLTYHDEANTRAQNAGFDVTHHNEAGTPAWATAYQTQDDDTFDAGGDTPLFEAYEVVTATAFEP